MRKDTDSAIDTVADIVRDRIKSGLYGSAGIIPSTTELAKEFGHDKTLVADAMLLLRSQGYVRYVRNRYMVDTVRFTLPGIVKNFEQWVVYHGYQAVIQNLIQPELVSMDHETTELFGLPDNFQAVHRIRLQGIPDIPLRIAENWYPADLAGQFLQEMTDDPNMDVIGTMSLTHDLYIVKTAEYTVARIPTRQERDWLKLARYQPILETLRINTSQHGTPLMLNRILLVGTKFVLHREYEPDHWRPKP